MCNKWGRWNWDHICHKTAIDWEIWSTELGDMVHVPNYSDKVIEIIIILIAQKKSIICAWNGCKYKEGWHGLVAFFAKSHRMHTSYPLPNEYNVYPFLIILWGFAIFCSRLISRCSTEQGELQHFKDTLSHFIWSETHKNKIICYKNIYILIQLATISDTHTLKSKTNKAKYNVAIKITDHESRAETMATTN